MRRACERPEQVGRSLSQWDCAELARQLVLDEVVAAISPQTVQRILAANRLKPWRSHVWLHPRTPRDATFAAHVRAAARPTWDETAACFFAIIQEVLEGHRTQAPRPRSCP